MGENSKSIKQICLDYGNDRNRLMDVINAVQAQDGCVSSQAMDEIAPVLGINRVDVESTRSFYAFLSEEKKGNVIVRLCDDIVDQFSGLDEVEKGFSEVFGINAGESTTDGMIALEHTPCIGMCDQAPAAIINETVFTNLTKEKARSIASALKEGKDPQTLVTEFGDGNNAHDLVKSMVKNNIIVKGEVILNGYTPSAGLKKALDSTPDEIITTLKNSNLRGRGGAGFPTGLKWDFTKNAAGDTKYVICNADEGEPGTFKDRVLLTECADMMFEGMTIAAYALGAKEGILYLRGEYAYLKKFLEATIAARIQNNLLGNNILGKEGFNFTVRIQMGAGAYVCGEETSLISSCEGRRGDPKTKPPFPAQEGYLKKPTVVNNVGTLCSVVRIIEKGSDWFFNIGSAQSKGTKLLSVSGDCNKPGVFEVPFGTKLSEVLSMAEATDTQAVLVAGPSGLFVNKDGFNREICFDDLATGGAIVVFNNSRNILKVASYYMSFFIEESCGYCTPCRVGNVLLKKKLDEIIDGRGEPADLDYLNKLGASIKFNSRCGLGQTSPNPVLTTITAFKDKYDALVKVDENKFQPSFDIKEALVDAEAIAERQSVKF